MTILSFYKMHALGNDFVLLDTRARRVELPAGTLRLLADRRCGIGCDQVLTLEHTEDADARCRIYNADGNEAGQCGNGVRCAARFLFDRGRVDTEEVTLSCRGGTVRLQREADGWIGADLGVPSFEPADIPMTSPGRHRTVALLAGEFEFVALSVGNPHAVIRVPEVAGAPVAAVGAALQKHALFPEGVNVGFVEIVERGRIRLRVYERGVGETPACGTGACAAAIAGVYNDWLNPAVEVEMSGGMLRVRWSGAGRNVHLSGPANYVFEGKMEV